MEFVVDIILLMIFALIVIFGAVNGFVKTVLGIVATIAAFILAYELSALLAPKLYESFLNERVFETIKSRLVNAKDAKSAAQQATAVLSAIPAFVINIAAAIGIDTKGIAEKIKGLNNSSTAIAKELTDNIAAPIVTAVVHAILFAVILAVFYILFMVVVRIIDKIFKLPFLKTANKIMGALLGAVKGLAVVYLLCIVLAIVTGISKNTVIAQAIESSKVVNFVNNNNFIINKFHI